jgi:hypothetical protein
MPDPYTWLDGDGRVEVRIEDSYAFYPDEDGTVWGRQAIGILGFDADGAPWVTVPIEVETPQEPEAVAVLDLEIASVILVMADIDSQATHDNEIGSEATASPEIGLEVTWEATG